MERVKHHVAVGVAFAAGVVLTLACTVFSGNARAARSYEYKAAKTATDVVNLGAQGWEYVGLGPGGQGIMKK
jgi:hypothetical protein